MEPDADDPCRLYLVTPTTADAAFADTFWRGRWTRATWRRCSYG